MDYLQLSRGPLHVLSRVSRCADVWVTRQSFNRTVTLFARPPKDSIALILFRSHNRPPRFHGLAVDSNHAVILPGGEEAIIHCPEYCEVSTASIARESLVRVFEPSAGKIGDPRLEAGLRPVRREIVQKLEALVQRTLFITPNSSGPEGVDIALAKTLQQLIGRWLSEHPTPMELPRRIANRVEYVRKARSYLDAHLHDEVRVNTLAAVAGVDERTLRLAFEEIVGTRPIEYIRVRRLCRARKELSCDDGITRTVTETAMNVGFTHLSSFAREYRCLFGELPSETKLSPRCRMSSVPPHELSEPSR